jgi:hypothetical protein
VEVVLMVRRNQALTVAGVVLKEHQSRAWEAQKVLLGWHQMLQAYVMSPAQELLAYCPSRIKALVVP